MSVREKTVATVDATPQWQPRSPRSRRPREASIGFPHPDRRCKQHSPGYPTDTFPGCNRVFITNYRECCSVVTVGLGVGELVDERQRVLVGERLLARLFVRIA